MDQVRLTPWADWREWSFVRERIILRPQETHMPELVKALQVVEVWRVRGKIPHSADCSALLREVMMNDASFSRSENELRLNYSMVITRAVNGLVDRGQKGYFATSISVIAEGIGLPHWLVELRHDATHNQLPSLSVLRAAATELLLWLEQNYWQPQFEYLQQLSELCLPSLVAEEEKEKILFNKGSTVCVQLFIPLFLQSSLVPLPRNPEGTETNVEGEKTIVGAVSSLSSNKGKEDEALHHLQWCSQNRNLWLDSIRSLCSLSPQWIHVLLCHLASHALDMISSPLDEAGQVEGVLFAAVFWVQEILKLATPSSLPTLRADLSRQQMGILLKSMRKSTQGLNCSASLSERGRALQRNLLAILEIVYDPSSKASADSSFSSLRESDALSFDAILLERLGEINSCQPSSAKRKFEDSVEDKASPDDSLSQPLLSPGKEENPLVSWPLGMVPGRLSQSDLYSIKLISAQSTR